jgi:hypothetical protein
MTTFRPLAQEINRPQEEKERVRELGGGDSEVVGFIDVSAGESTAFVPFPVRFFERPCFTFGFELAENQMPVAGSFPTVSATVYPWEFGRRGETGAVFYTGATLLIVALGHDGMKGTLHYRFEGRSLTGSS